MEVAKLNIENVKSIDNYESKYTFKSLAPLMSLSALKSINES